MSHTRHHWWRFRLNMLAHYTVPGTYFTNSVLHCCTNILYAPANNSNPVVDSVLHRYVRTEFGRMKQRQALLLNTPIPPEITMRSKL